LTFCRTEYEKEVVAGENAVRPSRVKIDNFHSIESCEFFPQSLCALIGANNAGKSNILRALRTELEPERHMLNSIDDQAFFHRELF
jgi:putative ATP-dependent endonuclease of the OLD family